MLNFRFIQARVQNSLDGLGRLGIAPWELFQLAVYAIDFLLLRAAAFWREKGRRPGDKGTGEIRVLWIVHITESEIAALQPGQSRSVPYALANNQGSNRAAARVASNCATMKPGAEAGAMPAKLSLNMRATVTAGLAKEVEAVNQ